MLNILSILLMLAGIMVTMFGFAVPTSPRMVVLGLLMAIVGSMIEFANQEKVE